jgi:hypothetical protein
MSKIKKMLLGIGFMFALLIGTPVFAYAATLSTQTITGAPGDSLTVDLSYAAQGSSVSALNFDLTYDASRLTLTSVTIGAAGTSASKIVSSNAISSGLEKVIVYGINTTVIGDGVLIRATFTIKSAAADGSAVISIGGIVGSSPTAQAVPITPISGGVTVDGIAPTVIITEPLDGADVASGTVTVSGTVDDSTVAVVDVNGTAMNVTSGNFTGTLTLTEGDHTITAAAEDSAGNSGTDTIDITVDLTAPLVVITAPNNGDIIATGSVTVVGSLDDLSISQVDINGAQVSVTGGNFSHTVSLDDGDHTVTVTATDAAGNVGNKEITVTIDTTAPVVTITNPLEGAKYSTSSVTIQGTVNDPDIAQVDVNGQSVAVSNGTFSVTLTLTEGSNLVSVTATDAANNSSVDTVTVTFKLGDINEDGVVNATDVSIVRDQVIQVIGVTASADINNDGVVNVLDMQSIINRI